jgi:hypothetical protein
MSTIADAERHDSPGLSFEFVPGITAVIEDCVNIFKHAVGQPVVADECRPMLGLESTVSVILYCRGYDELRNSQRCRSQLRQHVPTAVGRRRHMRKTANCPRRPGDSLTAGVGGRGLPNWTARKLTESNGNAADQRDDCQRCIAGHHRDAVVIDGNAPWLPRQPREVPGLPDQSKA